MSIIYCTIIDIIHTFQDILYLCCLMDTQCSVIDNDNKPCNLAEWPWVIETEDLSHDDLFVRSTNGITDPVPDTLYDTANEFATNRVPIHKVLEKFITILGQDERADNSSPLISDPDVAKKVQEILSAWVEKTKAKGHNSYFGSMKERYHPAPAFFFW